MSYDVNSLPGKLKLNMDIKLLVELEGIDSMYIDVTHKPNYPLDNKTTSKRVSIDPGKIFCCDPNTIELEIYKILSDEIISSQHSRLLNISYKILLSPEFKICFKHLL